MDDPFNHLLHHIHTDTKARASIYSFFFLFIPLWIHAAKTTNVWPWKISEHEYKEEEEEADKRIVKQF